MFNVSSSGLFHFGKYCSTVDSLKSDSFQMGYCITESCDGTNGFLLYW